VRRLVDRVPQTRCYRCASRKLHSVCHHCTRPMCADHSPVKRRFWRRSAEFAKLGLRDTACGEMPRHCKKHRHVVRGLPIWLIACAVALTLAGIWQALGDRPRRGLLVLAVGLVVSCAATIVHWIRTDAARRHRPVLPLLPRFDPVEVIETLPVRITLDADGSYQAVAEAATGSLTIAATFGRADRERVQRYRRRFQLGRDRGVSFNLGFAVLRGPVGFVSGLGAHDPTVLQLDGHAHKYRVLDGVSEQVSEEWRKEYSYEVWQEPAAGAIPITLTPSMVQGAGRRGFDLDLQWPVKAAKDPGPRLIIDRVECLQLDVPMAWGDVQYVSGSNVERSQSPADGEQPAVQTVIWRQIPIEADDCRARGKRFAVRFEHPIDPGSVVRGRVEVHFKGTLSRLRGMDLYYPLGHRRADQAAPTITTKVVADFELRLGHIRHQDVRVVPDRKRAADDVRKESVFGQVVPDHNAIIALTNAISEQGYYVKRVIENPPQVGAHANRVNRYWDITGRKYRGVYPIDFHLIVAGEELYDGDIRAQAGTTKTTLTVQGAFANPTMEGQVEGVWEQLNDVIAETLG
jgi:hypothetical protein